MIITRTPFRVSFVGGGSDLRDFYMHSQGAVLSTTINKYMYIYSHNFFDEDKIRIKYSKTETVTDVNKINHPIVREVLKKFRVNGALEISSNADIPSHTGLGSSSSFTIGLLQNLHTKFGKHPTKEQLAEEACDIEINRLKEPIGKQDQYAAAFGGLNLIRFDASERVILEPLHLAKGTYNELQKNLLMFYTGEQRKASSILTEQKKNIGSRDKFEALQKMVGMVWQLKDALYAQDLLEFGKLLHKNWVMKKKLSSNVSSKSIDKYYGKALKNGAVGGKLLGAGSGGFLLFYCENKNHYKLRKAMSPLRELKIMFDNEGSKVLYIGDEYN